MESVKQQFLVNYNAIRAILGMVNAISYISSGDIHFDNLPYRNVITKKYKTWLLKHRPDKVEINNMIDIFIIKEYGGTRSTLLQYNDDEEKWRFMVKCGNAFSCFGDYQICSTIIIIITISV